jgi:hypothetical protein
MRGTALATGVSPYIDVVYVDRPAKRGQFPILLVCRRTCRAALAQRQD